MPCQEPSSGIFPELPSPHPLLYPSTAPVHPILFVNALLHRLYPLFLVVDDFERFWAGWLAGWLIGWLAGWLLGWLVGWLVGTHPTSQPANQTLENG